MATIKADEINFNDAEDFKLPTDGIHNGNLSGVDFGPTKKSLETGGNQEQFVLTVTLSPDDPDAPNLPMRYFVGWPVPEDKDVMWGSRTAYGSKVKTLKDLMTAFGGPESGGITKEKVRAFLEDCVGKAVKIKTKQEPMQSGEMGVNVRVLMPA